LQKLIFDKETELEAAPRRQDQRPFSLGRGGGETATRERSEAKTQFAVMFKERFVRA
jgi:hypothetical protein